MRCDWSLGFALRCVALFGCSKCGAFQQVGALGSSVTASHDNCNYDSYERQLERFLQPLFQSMGSGLEVRNAGQGGGCGDTYANQPFCVRHIVGDDVDVVHYSWT